MSFNDQADSIKGGGNKSFIFADGVKFKHMTGQQILFRLLPSFNPADPNPATSWLPCMDPNGNLTDWGAIIKIARFIGHGTGGPGSRQTLLSLKTFETPGNPVFCPLAAVYSAIQQDMETWGYLVDDGDVKDKNRVRAAYSRAQTSLVANIVDANQPHLGAQLGVFSVGASSNLIDKKTGILYQPNAAQNIDELLKVDHMAAYAYGDITHPGTAPLLICEKGTEKGEFSPYRITPAIGRDRKIMRMPVTQEIMSQRKDLSKFDSFLNIPTADDLVQMLIQLLNGRSPAGYHEYSLLRIALPQFQIPDPPQAPGAISGARGGFAPSPALEARPTPVAPQVEAPVKQAWETPPASQTWTLAGPGSITATAPAAVDSVAPRPGQMAPAPVVGQGPGQMAPAPVVGHGPGQMAPAPVVGGQVAPVTPGDNVPEFDEAAFLARIRGAVKQ